MEIAGETRAQCNDEIAACVMFSLVISFKIFLYPHGKTNV